MSDFDHVSSEYHYKIKFDPSLCFKDTWIDSFTTDFLNA